MSLKPGRLHLYGATAAQDDLGALLPELLKPSSVPGILNLDLEGVESVTSSYLRATLHWAFLCGQADSRNSQDSSPDPFSIRPLPVYPVISNCNGDALADVDDFFRSRTIPLLMVTEWSNTGIQSATLLGTLDSNLKETLVKLCDGPATAQELSSKSSEKITSNAWSNRLADLYSLRLVTRERSGKYWIYSSLANLINLWALIS